MLLPCCIFILPYISGCLRAIFSDFLLFSPPLKEDMLNVKYHHYALHIVRIGPFFNPCTVAASPSSVCNLEVRT